MQKDAMEQKEEGEEDATIWNVGTTVAMILVMKMTIAIVDQGMQPERE